MTEQNNYSVKKDLSHQWLWHASVACFLLAGLTGFLYRMGMLGWVPGELSLGNIRHAHSHLMFFGWAVPLPLYIIMQKILHQTDGTAKGVAWMKYSISFVLFFGLMSYPFFLFYGYRPVAIGSALLPLSVIFSGFVMISWYGFMVGYWKSRAVLKNEESQPWIDAALVLLAVCSLGAWGVAVIQEVAPESHLLMKSMTHFFLATFTEGWVVLVLCGILISELEIDDQHWWISPQFAPSTIAIGAPLTFPYGISESLLSPALLTVARLGGLLTATGLLLVIYAIFSSGIWKNRIWIWPILLLGIKASMQIFTSVIPYSFWLSDFALRIFYLHVLLLGGFTLAMIGWLHIRSTVSQKYFNGVALSVIAVLFSLLLPSHFWPASWSGIWIFYALAIAAILPILTISLTWFKMSGFHFDKNKS